MCFFLVDGINLKILRWLIFELLGLQSWVSTPPDACLPVYFPRCLQGDSNTPNLSGWGVKFTKNTKKGTNQTLSFYEKFAQGPLLNGLYWTTWYNNQPLESGNTSFIYYENMLLGVPRMRQIKIKNNSCTVYSDFENGIKGCFAVYTNQKEDEQSFGLINGSA